jgi:TonB-dependent starch-binding outer membrane protein SusC
MKNNLLKSLLVLLLSVFTSFAYSQSVSGKVSDASGPLPGASVVVKGSSAGVQTDIDGNYTINNVGANATLVYSFIGLKTQEINVAGKKTIDVVLQSDQQQLNEVVVIGYGSVKKKDATGAVDQLSSRKMDNLSAANPAEILRGKVAGVQVTSSSGEPGAAISLRIRGNSSLRAGNNPLIVVDGVPLDGGDASSGGADPFNSGTTTAKNPLNFINQNDIESMSILKDAASTAIYGARGANGVIIITTKKGKGNKPSINYNSSVGFGEYSGNLDVMSTQQYIAAGGTDNGGDYNWKNTLLRTSLTYNNEVAYSVSNDNSSTRISFGANQTEGIIKNTGMDKYTASFNNTTNLLDNFIKVDTKILYAGIKDKTTLLSEKVGFIGNALSASLYWNPTNPLYNTDGTYNIIGNNYLNPQQILDSYNDYTNTNKLLGSISPTVTFNKNLKYQLVFGIESSTSSRKSQILPTLEILDAAQATFNGVKYFGQADILNVNKFNKTFEHTLTYNKEFSENFNLDVVGGYSYYQYNFDANSITAKGFNPEQTNLIDNIQGGISFNAGDGTNNWGSRSFRNKVDLQSFFGRATANLYKKLFLTATLRRDGSSKAGEDNKYGNFYSVGAAYKIVEDKSGLVNDLKIRGVYGLTGNTEFAPNSALFFARYTRPDGSLGGQINGNPLLKWESTTSKGVGLDFELINNKLSGTLDYFVRETTDLIFAKPGESTQPAPNSTQFVNLPGKLINKGIEVSLSYKILNKTDLNWDISANASFLKNEIKDFNAFVLTGELNGQGLSGANSQVITNNYPAYTYYLYDFRGYDADGNSIYSDAAGNDTSLGTASKKLLDKTPLPKVNVGFSTSLNYKNFDFSTSFYGAFGHYLYNNTSNALFFKGAFPVRNVPLEVANSIQSSGDPNSPSTKYLEKGDFLRMGNVTLGYTLSGGILQKAKVQSLRLFVNAQNLFLITSYSGFDPEVDTNKILNGVPSAGIDYFAYPKAKTVSFGLNLNF